MSYFTNHLPSLLIFILQILKSIILCLRAISKLLSLSIFFFYKFSKRATGLSENEILKIAYHSPFDFLGSVIIIHVSLLSWPITGIKEGRLMRNTRYNYMYHLGITRIFSLQNWQRWSVTLAIKKISYRIIIWTNFSSFALRINQRSLKILVDFYNGKIRIGISYRLIYITFFFMWF